MAVEKESVKTTWFYAIVGGALGLLWGGGSVLLFVLFLPGTGNVQQSAKSSYAEYKTLRAYSQDFAAMDSILSIVQSYYVDSDRSGPYNLLMNAAQELSRQLSSCHLERSSSGDRLTIGDVVVRLPEKNSSYHETVSSLVEIATTLDQTQKRSQGQGQQSLGILTVANAMLGALDAHSALLTKDAYRELRQGTEGAFGGLGVLVGIRDKVLTVIKPLPKSPAARAGIRRLDKILHINNVSTFGFSLDDLVEFMRGDPGTPVNISILRDGALSPRELVLNREIINVNSVEADTIDTENGAILHLVVENFAARTSQEVWSAIQSARQKTGGELSGLILDLRSNPGGLLDQAVQLADLFLDRGTIVSTKGRRIEVEAADDGYAETNFPMMVLINNDTASASEIVSGALQDHNRALIIGQPSFGKGSVQTIFELPGEQALKLTVARYYTPSERSIQNVGIFPDIWLQPIFREKENRNLMGSSRYRSEQYLANHLHRSIEDQASAFMQSTTLMGYALAESTDEAGFEKVRKDEALELAKIIITQIKKRYPNELPSPAQRASHWLVMASKTIAEQLANQGIQAESWLKKRFDVDWKSYSGDAAQSLKLSLDASVIGTPQLGQKVKLPYKISNPSSYPVGRVSLFVRSSVPVFDSQELLIGGIAAHSEKQGIFEIEVPRISSLAKLDLNFGYAINAMPSKEEPLLVEFAIQTPVIAELSAEATLIDEKGGEISGVLESTELAQVKLTIRNEGPTDLHDFRMSIFNLSGKQVQIQQEEQWVPEIKVGTSVDLRVNIAASKFLAQEKLDFGLSMSCAELPLPVHQNISIKSLPELASKQVSRTGH